MINVTVPSRGNRGNAGTVRRAQSSEMGHDRASAGQSKKKRWGVDAPWAEQEGGRTRQAGEISTDLEEAMVTGVDVRPGGEGHGGAWRRLKALEGGAGQASIDRRHACLSGIGI